MKSKCGFLSLIFSVAVGLVACSESATKQAASGQSNVDEAVNTAVDAYVYGYSRGRNRCLS